MLYLDAYRLGLKGCTAYRPNEVTGAVLSPAPPAIRATQALQPALPLAPADALPKARETVLSGFTYKLKWPGSDHAIYVTINDIFDQGQRLPFEIL